MSGKKVSNIYGQVYGFVKEAVTSLEQIYPGDHLAYERAKLYWHHVIVEDIDKDSNEVKVIHYYNNIKDFFESSLNEGSLAQVMQGAIQFWPKRFYRILYDESGLNPPERVLELARGRLGETNYHPLTDNCEHFCSQCKIGRSVSVQVDSLIENTIVTVLPPLTTALLELLLKKTVQKSIEEFTKKTAKHFAQDIVAKLSQTVFQIALLRCVGFVDTQVAWTSLQQNTAVIVQAVLASEVKAVGKTAAKEVVKTFGGIWGRKKLPENSSPRKGICRMTKTGVLAGVAVELAFMGKDIRDASMKKTSGEITKQEYEETVIKRVVGGSVSTPMSLAGGVIGQYVLPVPVVGNVIGGITGSAAGRVVGAVLSAGVIKTRKHAGKLMKLFSWKRI